MKHLSLEALPPDSYVSIGQAARYCGVTPYALRGYQRKGLLAPDAKTPGGHWRYRVSTVMEFRRSWPAPSS